MRFNCKSTWSSKLEKLQVEYFQLKNQKQNKLTNDNSYDTENTWRATYF